MGPRHSRGPGGPRTANGRPDLPAYGNNTSWRDDDFRVAVIILLLGTAWIILAFRKRKNGNKGLFEGLGFGFGPAATPSFSSLDELVRELKDAGVSDAGLIVGVDFTRSNEWTGQKHYGKRSMHDVTGPDPNPYQDVLQAVGRGLGPLNRSSKVWCYGFGDESTKDESVFCFMANDGPCSDLEQTLDRYASIARAVSLSGPTSFAPLIRKAVEIVEDSGRQYHCLVIIADGQVTQEHDTVKAIRLASSYPLSIIMIGVGEGPWDTCREFDNRLSGRRFDNFRFVEHRRLRDGGAEALALSALAEVPNQYRAIRALRLMPGGTGSGGSAAAASVAGGGFGDVTPPTAAYRHGSAPSAPTAPPATDVLDEDAGVPKDFICPLTLEVMIDPVVCEDGHSYERGALEAWLGNHDTSPMSNACLNSTMVVPNHALRNSIEAWRRMRGY